MRFESQSGIVKQQDNNKKQVGSNLMDSIAQDMKFRHLLMRCTEKFGLIPHKIYADEYWDGKAVILEKEAIIPWERNSITSNSKTAT